jgi:hypothetical protein
MGVEVSFVPSYSLVLTKLTLNTTKASYIQKSPTQAAIEDSRSTARFIAGSLTIVASILA